MRGLFSKVAIGAAVLLASTAANAVVVFSPTPVPVTPGTVVIPPASAIFGNTFGGNGDPAVPDGTAIHDVFSFTITGVPGAYTDATLNTILMGGLHNVDFGCDACSIYIDTNIAANTFHLVTGSNPEVWALTNPINLTPTTHNLFVNGLIVTGPSAGYSGQINFNVAPVPEPATWAMMLLGFLGIGMVVRRSSRPVLAQIA